MFLHAKINDRFQLEQLLIDLNNAPKHVSTKKIFNPVKEVFIDMVQPSLDPCHIALFRQVVPPTLFLSYAITIPSHPHNTAGLLAATESCEVSLKCPRS